MKLCAIIFWGGWVGGPGPSLPEHTTGGGGWVVWAKESHVCPWPVKRPLSSHGPELLHHLKAILVQLLLKHTVPCIPYVAKVSKEHCACHVVC